MRKVFETKFADSIKGKVQLKVYYNSEYEEYIVRLYLDGTLYSLADYFTDDKQDAILTARAELTRMVDTITD